MSLIHWWPLITDLKDIIGNSTVTGTYTADANGKIGQCYKNTGSGCQTSVKLVEEWSHWKHSVSMSCWVKINYNECNTYVKTLSYDASLSKTNATGNLIGQVSYGGLGIYWRTNNAILSNGSIVDLTTISFRGYTRGSSTTQQTSAYTVEFDKWYHMTLVADYEQKVLKFYVNGEQIGTDASYASVPEMTDNRQFAWGCSEIYGGNGPGGNLPMRLNDIKLYNHALSKKEVKELSKGLVCHYTFEEPGLTPNIFNTATFLKDTANRCTVVPYGSNGFTMTSTGDDPYIGTSANSGNGVGSLSTWYVGSANSQVCLSWRHVSGPELDKSYMTFLNSSGQALNATHNNFGASIVRNGSQRYVLQALPTGTVKVHIRFGNQTLASGSSITVDNICLKIGNNPLYSPYALTYTPYNNVGGIIQSTTNQGIYASSDAGIGKQSLECKGGTLITTPITGDITQGVTISCWIKGIAPTDNRVVFADYNSKLAFGFYNNGQAIITCAGYGHKCVTDIKTPWTSNWNHIVVCRDSAGVVKCFLNNNELSLNGSQEWTHSVNTFSIGGRYSGGWTSYFNGLVDDVRVYHTALSGDDIQELYKSRWSANKEGQVFSNVINEGQSKFQITRSGVNNCNILEETAVLPSSYIPLQYIQSSGAQYIDTGYYWKSTNAVIFADLMVLQNKASSTIFGNEEYYSGSSRYFAHILHAPSANGNYSSYIGTGAVGTPVTLSTNTRYIIEYNSHGDNTFTTKAINQNATVTTFSNKATYGGTILTQQNSNQTTTNKGHIFIFSNHNGSGTGPIQNMAAMKLYHFTMIDNGQMVRNFIPCQSGSSVGLYDTVEGKFYASGSGNFIAGPKAISQSRDGLLYCAEFNEI